MNDNLYEMSIQNALKNMGCKKQGVKTKVIVIQKEKRLGYLFSF